MIRTESRPTGQHVGRAIDPENNSPKKRHEKGRYRRIATAVGKVAAAGVFVAGALAINSELNKIHLGINVHGFSSTLPEANGKILKNSWHKTTEKLAECPDVLGVDVGVLSHNRVDGISGFKADHLYPVTYSKCGKGLVSLTVNKHYNSLGVVNEVSTNVPNYQPIDAGINFNNGQVLCMGLSSTATMKDVISAAKTYRHDKKVNENIQCDWGQGTTGFGFAGDKDPANNMMISFQSAQDAGVLSPIPNSVNRSVARDVKMETSAFLQAVYPTAKKIEVNYEALNPVQQIENNWMSQEPDIMNGAKYVDFSNSNGATQLNVTSRYYGMQGHVAFDVDLSNRQVNELNHFIHEPHDYSLAS